DVSLSESQLRGLRGQRLKLLRVYGPRAEAVTFHGADGIEALELEGTAVRRVELDGMASLRSLNIDGGDRRAKDVSLALDKLPELKSLRVNEAKLDRLPLEKFPK